MRAQIRSRPRALRKSRPRTRRSPARSKDFPPVLAVKKHLGLQVHTLGLADPRPHPADQLEHIGTGGVSAIHDEIRVDAGDFGATHPSSLEPALLDQSPRGRARRVLEHAPGARLARLRLVAPAAEVVYLPSHRARV